jgi:hypothetical protein
MSNLANLTGVNKAFIGFWISNFKTQVFYTYSGNNVIRFYFVDFSGSQFNVKK